MRRQREKKHIVDQLVGRCMSAFLEAGTLDVSLDNLSRKVGISKRMIVHYFGGRDGLERKAMRRLEDTLRAQFSPASFPHTGSVRKMILTLWERATRSEARGILLLVMDLARRAWSGSAAAQAFYQEQLRLWARLLQDLGVDKGFIQTIIVTFQGAVLMLLTTGNPDPGKQALLRLLSGKR